MTESADATFARAAKQLYALKAERKALEEQEAELVAFFKGYEAFADLGEYVLGEYTIVVSKNARVDDTLARQTLTDTEYLAVSKTVVDSVKAKRLLTGEGYEKIQKKFSNKIEVRKND